MIKILIDSTSIKKIPDGAISVHLFIGRLLSGINQSIQLYPILATWKGMADYWDSLADYYVDKIIINEKDKVSPSIKLDRILGLIPFEKELKKRGIQVVLTPQFVPYIFIYPRKYNQHLIIHDLFTFRYPKNKTMWYRLYNWLMIKIASTRIPNFISISQTTKNDVLSFTHRNSDVVYNSIPFDFNTEETSVPEVNGKRFILDVNRLVEYNNPQLLVKALSLIKTKIPHILY